MMSFERHPQARKPTTWWGWHAATAVDWCSRPFNSWQRLKACSWFTQGQHMLACSVQQYVYRAFHLL
jgi:hypothetical protein